MYSSKPTFSSHRIYTRSEGSRFCDFSESLLTATRGFKQGAALVPAEWQKDMLEALFEINNDGYWRHRTAVIGVPRKNGKSLLTSIIILYCLLFYGEGVQLYSAAVDREQAKVIYTEIANQIRRNKWLSKYLKVTRDKIVNPSTGAVYKPLSADASSAQGLGPLIVVIDEVGEWKGSNAENLVSALTEGSGDRPQAMTILISTAGYQPESILGGFYKHGRRVSLPKDDENYLDDPSFFFRWWEAPKGADIFDEKTWAMANPNYECGYLAKEDFQRAIANPTPFNIAKFQRYRLNQWVRVSGVEFISSDIWERAKTDLDIPLGAEISIGFDGSQTGDSTGLVAMDMKTGVIKVLGSWENLNDEKGWYVDRDEVYRVLSEANQDYDIKILMADPSYFQQDLLRWSRDLKINVVKVPANQMAKWAQRFTSAIIYKESFQPDDIRLTTHVFNAVLREDGSFEKINKYSKEKIDLLVCATLANAGKEFFLGKTKPGIKPAYIYGSADDEEDYAF